MLVERFGVDHAIARQLRRHGNGLTIKELATLTGYADKTIGARLKSPELASLLGATVELSTHRGTNRPNGLSGITLKKAA